MAVERHPLNVLKVISGEDPFLSIAQARLPMPPTRSEAESGGFRYEQQRLAIKRALVYRTSLAKANRYRISAENNRSTAAMARHLGAPAVFCEYLEHLASGELSYREERVAEQALRHVAQNVYGVDILRIRQVSESLELPGAAHTAAMLAMPVSGMYDAITVAPPADSQVLPDIQTMTTVQRQLHGILASVHDKASAQAAAEKLADMIPLWSTTFPSRVHGPELSQKLTPAEKMSAQLLNYTIHPIVKLRKELDDKEWYGCELLMIMDEQFR